MTIDFYSSHLETLTELKALADKHNCKIQFGIRSNTMQVDDIDVDYLVKHFNCPKKIAKEICEDDNYSFEPHLGGEMFEVYFELIDCNDTNHFKYNVLTKTICEFSFKIHVDYYNDTNEKVVEWIENNSLNNEYGWGDEDYIMSDTHENEEVSGFKGVIQDGWCYRTGMILAVFAQLVCDYLGEERIKRTY